MTARVLESLEEKDSVAFAAACESLWGEGAPVVHNDEPDLVTPAVNRKVSPRANTARTGSSFMLAFIVVKVYSSHTLGLSIPPLSHRTD